MESCIFSYTMSDLSANFQCTLSESERATFDMATTNFESVDYNELLDVCSSLECRRRPTKDKFEEILSYIAHKEIIQKPKFIIDCWEPVLKGLMGTECVVEIYNKRIANSKNVLNILTTDMSPLSAAAEKVFSFFKKVYTGM